MRGLSGSAEAKEAARAKAEAKTQGCVLMLFLFL